MNRLTIWLPVLILLIVLGGWLRARGIAERALWYDEADTWNASIHDVGRDRPIEYSQFFRWTNHFETAPLSFLLVRATVDVMGSDEEWVMRLPSLVFGILCIPVAFLLGRVVHSNALGLALAALVAVDPSAVHQAQQCRMYSLYLFLTLLTATLAIPLFRQPRVNVWRWVALGAAMGLLLCTLQFSLCVWAGVIGAAALITLGMYFLSDDPEDATEMLQGMTLAVLIGVLMSHVGVYLIAERILSGGQGDGAHMTPLAIAREIVVIAKDLIGVGPVGLLVYPLALVGLVLLARECKTSVVLLVCIAAANLAMLFPFRKMHHFMEPRYLMSAQPALWAGIAFGAVYFKQPRWRAVGVVVLVAYLGVTGFMSFELHRWQQRPDMYLVGDTIRDLDEYSKVGDAIAYHPQVMELLGHYYDHPENEVLESGLYDAQQLRDNPQVPETFDAPRTVLVIGMVNWEGRVERAKKTIDAIAKHYGVEVDAEERDRHLKLERVTVATFSEEKVTFVSKGVGE